MKTAAPFAHESPSHLLFAYVADLELEVDRLRKLAQFQQHEARQTVLKIKRSCDRDVPAEFDGDAIAALASAVADYVVVLKDGYEPVGYHPSHDQVVAIALRPHNEQVFSLQQR
jgi:hypothetical protein